MNKRFTDVKKAKTRDRRNNEDVTFKKKNYKWGYVVLISVFIQYISVIELNSVSTWKTVYTEFHIFFLQRILRVVGKWFRRFRPKAYAMRLYTVKLVDETANL